MSKQQNSGPSILDGASDTLQRLWKQRDIAMEYEKNHGITPRTSDRYLKAQIEVDNLFLPKKQKAQRKKPKVKVYTSDPDWCY